jgi:hypothetical protein
MLRIWYAAATVAWEWPRSDQRTCARDAFGRTARALPDRAPLVSTDICMAAIAVLYKRVMTLYTKAGCARSATPQQSRIKSPYRVGSGRARRLVEFRLQFDKIKLLNKQLWFIWRSEADRKQQHACSQASPDRLSSRPTSAKSDLLRHHPVVMQTEWSEPGLELYGQVCSCRLSQYCWPPA